MENQISRIKLSVAVTKNVLEDLKEDCYSKESVISYINTKLVEMEKLILELDEKHKIQQQLIKNLYHSNY